MNEKKIQVKFERSDQEILAFVQEQTGKNQTDAVLDALRIYAWVIQQVKKGDMIVSCQPDGNMRELVLPFLLHREATVAATGTG